MIDRIVNRKASAVENLKALQQFRGSEVYGLLVKLLTDIDEIYREEMLTIPAEKLAFKQGGAKQTRALLDALLEVSEGFFVDVPKS